MRNLQQRWRAGEEGFTLAGLLVVIVIIALLVAIALPIFFRQKQKAYRAGIRADLRAAGAAEEGYFTGNRQYVAGAASTALTNDGFRLTRGNVITVARTTRASYCIAGYNRFGVGFYLYRSDNGGLQPLNTGTC